MGFFGGGRGGGGGRPGGFGQQGGGAEVRTTAGGVPLDAIARLRRMRGEGGKPLFTSDLSVSEFVLLNELGMVPVGLVLGSSIYHVGLQYANFYNNEELGVLTQAMYQARELAMARMEEEATTLGADGVVGVRLEIGAYAWAGEALEFTAVGTAVRAPEGADYKTMHGKPFTSDLNVQDFYKLHEAGYVPAELVLGNCVYHVAHQGWRQSLSQFGANVELPNYTEAIYEARELAMSRMQAEAEAHGAEGIVGMQIVEKNHVWQPHVIEFLAIGTSIVKRGTARKLAPQFQIGLND